MTAKPPKTVGLERLLTPQEVSGLTGFSLQTLAHWRSEGREIKFVRLAGRVRYRARDVHAWIENRRESA